MTLKLQSKVLAVTETEVTETEVTETTEKNSTRRSGG